jgi:hypothetical protein
VISLCGKQNGTAKQIAVWTEDAMASKNAAYGSILGAFVGDAAGGVLEFLPGARSGSMSKQEVRDSTLSRVPWCWPGVHIMPSWRSC